MKFKIQILSACFLLILFFNSKVYADQTEAISASNITIINNCNSADEIKFTNVELGDTIFIYPSTKSKTILAGKIMTGTSDSIFIPQLGVNSGEIYISYQKPNKTESTRIAVKFLKEEISNMLASSDITITNNFLGSIDKDKIRIDNINIGDTINVYLSDSSPTSIAKVTATDTFVEISIFQLSLESGYVYISKKEPNKIESPRRIKQFDAESVTTDLLSANIEITNNFITSKDKISINGVEDGDIINVYKSQNSTTTLATITATGASAEIEIDQLGRKAGFVFVAIKNPTKWESKRVKVSYPDEPVSSIIDPKNVTTHNYIETDKNEDGTAENIDSVDITGLVANSEIKFYSNIEGGKLIASYTATDTSLNITYPNFSITGGNIYISVTEPDKWESDCILATYESEISQKPASENITVVNNSGSADTIDITGLTDKDIVYIYNKSYTSSPVKTLTATSDTVSTTIDQLGAVPSYIYVSIKSEYKRESPKTPVKYDGEPASSEILNANVTVTNNISTFDVINISNLVLGDIVRVYTDDFDETPIATCTVDSDTAIIQIPQLSEEKGSIYISLQSLGFLESERTQINYLEEPTSDMLNSNNVTIVNNLGTNDSITVKNLTIGDTITIYPELDGEIPIISKTSDSDTMTLPISLVQNSGFLYVSLTNAGMNESKRIKISYSSVTSSKPNSSDIEIINNYYSTDDIITVKNLTAGEIVNIYTVAKDGEPIMSATAETDTVTISTPQLGLNEGSIYVSVVNPNELESDRVKKLFLPEIVTTQLLSTQITIDNNYETSDKITITGLSAGDLIKVYTSGDGGLPLLSELANDTSVTFYIDQLGISAGNIYFSIQKSNEHESKLLKKSYDSEYSTSVKSILITNNYSGINDQIKISGLVTGEIVKIYSATNSNKIIATGIASGDVLILPVSQLGTSSGYVFFTITSLNKRESKKLRYSYSEEPISKALSTGSINVKHNSNGTCKVTVSNLVKGDVVKIYSSTKSYGKILASDTATSATLNLTFEVDEVSGIIFVSVTSPNMWESSRIAKKYN